MCSLDEASSVGVGSSSRVTETPKSSPLNGLNSFSGHLSLQIADNTDFAEPDQTVTTRAYKG